jgi:hypothetical protein
VHLPTQIIELRHRHQVAVSTGGSRASAHAGAEAVDRSGAPRTGGAYLVLQRGEWEAPGAGYREAMLGGGEA